jgi:hypothetical protein
VVVTYLDSRDPHTHMRCLDHAHVVRTVTDCQENALLVLLDKFDDESFLKWRYSATDDCATHERELQKGLGELFLQCETQAFAVCKGEILVKGY